MNNKNDTLTSKGYELVNFCEFDKYAATSYCAIHGVDESLNLGDITKVDETKITPFNFICGGSPCFPAGTKVITDSGLKNIEDIKIGDSVYTHKHRYMKVDNIGGELNKEIYKLKTQGFLDIFATSYHPFYVKKSRVSEPEKVKLCDIQKGYYIGSPINQNSFDNGYLSEELCWILGRYVADGHIRKDKRAVFLSNREVINSAELVEVIEMLDFGKSAITKKIPQNILDLPVNKLKIFLNGYMSEYGCRIKNAGLYSATTISKEFAMNLCQAIQKVYKVGCGIYYTETPDATVIENGIVNQNNTYIVRFIPNIDREHLWFLEDNVIWYPVKSVESTGTFEDVYNIEVNTDHTYIADNAIVFNCQDFSVAGGQAGSKWKCKDCNHEYNPLTVHYSERDKCPHCGSVNLDKTRSSLLVEWLRVIRANKPKWGIYENVKNIVGKKFKDTFQMFIDELHEYGYNTYYKVLNAKDFGIPQNRERVYLIIILKEFDNGQFKFPEGFDNGIRLKDILEDEVDEKYYINTPKAKELIDDLISSGKLEKDISNTVRAGGERKYRPTSMGYGSSITTGLFSNQCSKFDKEIDVANTLLARDYKGFGNQSMNGVIECKK